MDYVQEIQPPNATPGLESLLDFGDGKDVGADLSSNSGEVGVLLLQLHQVMKLGWNENKKEIEDNLETTNVIYF